MNFDTPNLPQSPDIEQNSDSKGVSPIKVNCYNFRTIDDIKMKRGPVTKFYKRNKMSSKKFDDDFMSSKCDVIVIFPIYG